MSGISTNLIYTQLAVHSEILKELENYLNTGDFKMADGSSINIEGYTAERLNREVGMTPLMAYNFLVYLKEFPKLAKEDLELRLTIG